VFFNYNIGAFNLVAAQVPEGDDIVLSVAPDFNNGGIDLTWNDPFDNENEWVIERSVDYNTGFTPIDTVAVNTTTFKDVNVEMLGTAYYYRVFARNPAGSSALSNEDSWLGVGMGEVNASHLKVFPNPASDQVRVVLSGEQSLISVELIDALGRPLMTRTLNAETVLDVSSLAPGAYFLRARLASGGVITKPVQIVR
jgi:hypothetical protein